MHPTDLDRDAIVRTADHFRATAFRGHGRWEARETKTLAEAEAAAAEIYQPPRAVLIYAVRGARSVHVKNWRPAALPGKKG